MSVHDASALEKARVLVTRGLFSDALPLLNAEIHAQPSAFAAWFLRGVVHHRLANLDAARRDLLEATRLEPGEVQPLIALAAVSVDAGDFDTALSACTAASDIVPESAQVWFSLGVTQEKCGAEDDALVSYIRALNCDSQHVGAYKNQIALHVRLNRNSDALACAIRYAATFPFAHDAQFSLGEAFLAIGDHEQAAKAFRRARSLDPRDVRVLLHEGCALAMCERFPEAQIVLDRAASLAPQVVASYRSAIFHDRELHNCSLDARTLFLLRHYDRIECCDWRDRDYFLDRFVALIAEAESSSRPLTERALGFRAMAMGLDLNSQRLLARQIASAVVSPDEPLRGALYTRQGEKLRIGYVSPDFRMHPIGLMTSRLYGWHDRSKFEVYCYALGGDDGSEIRHRIEQGCDHFAELNQLDDHASIRRIAADGIDILIDLAGFTEGARPAIFAARPAPLQISWLGYAATMGAPWIDAIVADTVCLPDAHEHFYTEAVLRMPAGQYLCSYAIDEVLEPSSKLEAGLPEASLVLAAMHNPYKIDPETFSCWMRLLVRHEQAVLWLLDTTAVTRKNLTDAALINGVSSDRLVFAARVPHARHIERLKLADIVLDAPQCNGSTTICDALIAGVPVVSCLGATFAQRMAGSVLGSADLLDWAVTDMCDYERVANRLLASPDELKAARCRVSEVRKTSLFYRPQDWVRHLESGYTQMWSIAASGRPLKSIRIIE